MVSVNAHFSEGPLLLGVPRSGVNVVASMQRFAELVKERIRAILGEAIEYLHFGPAPSDDMHIILHGVPCADCGNYEIDTLMQTLKTHIQEIKDSRQWVVRAAT